MAAEPRRKPRRTSQNVPGAAGGLHRAHDRRRLTSAAGSAVWSRLSRASEGMRIVTVGGTGNIGTALVRALGADHDVHVVARRLPEETGQLGANVTAHAADIARDSLDVVAGADAVVHLAWLFQPSHQPETTWRSNVLGTARLLDAVRRGGVGSLVVSSSIAAYSPVDGHALVDEGHPTHGASAAAYCREK